MKFSNPKQRIAAILAMKKKKDGTSPVIPIKLPALKLPELKNPTSNPSVVSQVSGKELKFPKITKLMKIK